MPRLPTLTYDRGTLILHPPPRGKAWVEHAEWDDRVERFRIPADRYRPLVEALEAEGTLIEDHARAFTELPLKFAANAHAPHRHQADALAAWEGGRAPRRRRAAHGRGQDARRAARAAIDRPQHASSLCRRSTCCTSGTPDCARRSLARRSGCSAAVRAMPDAPLLVSTYVSAAAEAERLGNRFALLDF